MKRLFTLSLLLAVCQATAFSQVIHYVKKDAAGANTGTSWQDAFTELHTALDAADNGDQIWVAAGTYLPQSSPANASLLASTAVRLYGGFAGTENSLDQRNPLANVTILSGDIAGDDIAGDFTQKRTDNARHVLVVSSDPQYTTTVDGFLIKGGHTLIATADPDLEKRGGGLLATTPVVVRNCVFRDNYALSGAGMACIGANASASRVDGCLFEANHGTSQSAGVFFRALTSGELNRCTFRNNTTFRGAFYPNSCKSIVVDSCLFENNTALPDNFGGAMFAYQSSFVLSNSVFRGNKSNNGAGIYNDMRDGGNYATITDCVFEGNETTGYGGTALYNWKANFELVRCQFKANIAPTTGAAMYSGGGSDFQVRECTFEDGQAGFGAGVANYGVGTKATYNACTFKNNRAGTSGGGMTNGFLANVTVKNCTFDANSARFGGGMFNQNDSTSLTLDNVAFIGNVAENSGGGLNVSAGIAASLKNCLFNLNTANIGGAINFTEDSLDLAVLDVDATLFQDNFAGEQAAGLNVLDANVTLTNCLFANNLNTGSGAGGAISNNAGENKTSAIKAVNCTFVNNDAPIGAGIAQWENATGTATLTLQNCVLQNIQDNYGIEDGSPDVFSLGGNLSSDASANTYFIGTNDLNETDPQFEDASSYKFTPLLSSPCIDGGIAAGAPTTDLYGNPRINAPDMGGIENQEAVGVGSPSSPVFALQLTPNPAVDFVQTTIENDLHGAVETTISTIGGQMVRQLASEKTGTRWDFRTPVQDLPAGIYLVRVRVGGAIFAGSFVK